MWKQCSFLGKIGIFIILFYCISGFCYVVAGSDQHRVSSGEAFESPNKQHLLGTDDLGIDVLSQLLFGASISMSVGISVAILAGIGGSIVGMVAAYYGGKVDRFVMMLADISTAIPSLVVMIVVGVFMPFHLVTMIVLMALLMWVGPARICRARMFSMREEPYLLVAKSYGASLFYILKRHMMRAFFPMFVVNVLRVMSQAITMEASLAFLGVGDPTVNSWGNLIYQSIHYQGIYYTDYWQWWVVPAVMTVVVLMLAMAFVGRDMEKMVNQKLVS